ncbi:MAG: 2OG-Fe(II) oxygenase [Cyanobacteria bacterium P01_G01_bin.19]
MKISANDLSYIACKVKNIPRKLKREIFKIPPIQAIKEQAYQKALDNHACFLPKLDAQGKSIVEKLRQEGTCIIPIEELELSSTEKMLKTAFDLADKLKDITPQTNNNCGCEIGSDPEDLREFSEMLLWALEPKLLDIVENYIGLPIVYQGFAMRKSIVDGQYSGVRRWHIDWEDRRIIKVIIYLNDVAEGGGAYNYISRSTTPQAIKKLNYYNLGYVSDQEMASAVPKSNWIDCLAPQGTVVISDTSSVFHRAQPPTVRERYSITFCYTSANPQVLWNSRKITQEQWKFINENTNQRQKNCLYKKRLQEFIKK